MPALPARGKSLPVVRYVWYCARPRMLGDLATTRNTGYHQKLKLYVVNKSRCQQDTYYCAGAQQNY